jgi:hypothetical protein
MFKKWMIPMTFCVVMTACSQVEVVPTATNVPTEPPAPILTSTMTPTLEPWMQSLPEGVVTVEVEDEQIVGLDADGNQAMVYSLNTGEWETLTEQVNVEGKVDLKIVHEESIESVVEGVPVFVNILTDNSVTGMEIDEVRVHAGHHNVDGLLSPDAIADFTAHQMYQVYVENHKSDQDEVASFEEYMQMVAEARNGVRDELTKEQQQERWSRVAVQIAKGNSLATEEYDPKPTQIAPFWDGDTELPAGVWGINEFNYALIKERHGFDGKPFGVKNIDLVEWGGGFDWGFAQGTNLTGTRLIQYCGLMSSGRELEATGRFMSIAVAQSTEYLISGMVTTAGKSVDDYIESGLGQKLVIKNRSNNYSSVFTVYPQNSEEKKTNIAH